MTGKLRMTKEDIASIDKRNSLIEIVKIIFMLLSVLILSVLIAIYI